MKISTYTVKPNLPPSLKALDEIARNLWLSWNYDAVQLFIRLDYDSWTRSQQSPVRTLGMVSQEHLLQAAQDDSYIAALNSVYERFQKYKNGETWYKGSREKTIAYFSMEYGMDVSLPIYSGGLGILSGDHMKTSSDMGLPLVGIGLLYRQGYFTQNLNADGFQQEGYPENDWYNMPVERKEDTKGNPIKISVDLAGKIAIAQIWEVKVGRSSLYLLDTNIDENSPEIRNITAALYGGDKETRIQQEILLGIGGIRALRALGINPSVTHMNEGHAAFLGLERIRELMNDKQFSFDEAREALWPTNIFTTHTPVPAGNERFEIWLVEKYFRSWAQSMGIPWHDFLGLGRINPNDDHETYCMTVLALKLSAYANGVAKLHGKVSREMWQGLWPGLPLNEVPIKHVTNGVHPRTWISSGMMSLLERYFGPSLEEDPTRLAIWDRMSKISDEELWRTHERRREQLVVFARERIRQHIVRTGAVERRVQQAEDALSPSALTLAFARRFATYKRGNLLLRDPERLLRLVRDNKYPVQLIFAGKAHPMDLPGKEIIREIIHFAEKYDVTNRIVFIENYDMTVARYLTSGADVWFNTPRRPLEASGTSGMKAALNGVLNCSILDGWWDEAYTPEVGWAIGQGEQYVDTNLQDDIESKALYDLLERDIIPLFYQRGRDGLPREWTKRMKATMGAMGQSMASHRMLLDYYNGYYAPALNNYQRIVQSDYAESKSLAAYFAKIQQAWNSLKIIRLESNAQPVMQRGDTFTVTASIELGTLKPEELLVELYAGAVSNHDNTIDKAKRLEMKAVGNKGTCYEYQVKVTCDDTGFQGYTVRILPKHAALVHPYRSGFIRWAE
ncbi:alpha-glucan phosphorylase [Spirochaetia bacterium]|nr:alpha-glucan phosphorylase [Spirochaetia bacterium]GHU30094.1 alpha-glucan phosphorylase [Spirochaetia bacterium]